MRRASSQGWLGRKASGTVKGCEGDRNAARAKDPFHSMKSIFFQTCFPIME